VVAARGEEATTVGWGSGAPLGATERVRFFGMESNGVPFLADLLAATTLLSADWSNVRTYITSP
jgi:hypothetical protein